MTMLAVAVTGASPARSTAAPAIDFRLSISEATGVRVHAIALRCQTRIEARRRRYAPDEQQRLYELFGTPSQWERTLGGVTWAQTAVVVPGFERQIEIDLSVPCTYDLEVASAKYLHGVRAGAVPLAFLFTGTIFTVAEGRFAATPVPWDLEASFRMPADVWHAAMNRFFPAGGWLRLRRETIDRLQAFRGAQAVVTWDDAIERLLQAGGQPV